MCTYINIKSSFHGVETVDEFTTRKEANKMLREYQMADRSQYYYTSQRSTKEWRKQSTN